MSQATSPRLIGAFVVGAAALAMVVLLVFGSGKFLRQEESFVLYFDGSLNGLSVGSPVKIRGVKVGTVSEILVVADEKGRFRIPVYIKVDLKRFFYEGEDRQPEPEQAVPMLIERGLRAQLAVESLVTGQLYIEIAFHPRTPVVLSERQDDYPELPTIPSRIEQLTEKFGALPVDELSAVALKALRGIEHVVNSPHVEQILKNTKETTASADGLLSRTDERLEGLTATANATLQDLRSLANDVQQRIGSWDNQATTAVSDIKATLALTQAVLEQARSRLVEVGSFTEQASVLYPDMSRVLQETAAAARSLRVLAEYLQRHPESLIYGKGRTR